MPALVVALAFASSSHASSLVWTRADIDTTLTAGYARSSLAIDDLGNPHVAYYVGGANDVRCATRAGATWLVEVVEDSTALDTPNITALPSLALDAQGRPHLVYICERGGLQALVHAFRDESGWHKEVVDAGAESLADCRLALDGTDRPHVVYSRWENSLMVLHYRVRDGAQWSDSVVGEGDQPALALDGAGSPAILFRSWDAASFMRLQYARPDGAGWLLTDVGLQANWPAVALDDAGQAHATAKVGSWVYYFTNGSGAWTHASILQTYTDARDAPIGIDRLQEPVIVCADNNRNVRWIYRRDGAWTLDWVSPDGGVVYGVTPSLALDAARRPAVVAYARPTLQLLSGVDTAIDWCDLMGPPQLAAGAGIATGPVLGRARIDGVTGLPGATPGLVAQMGCQPSGADPSFDPGGAQWFSATFAEDDGDSDVFTATLLIMSPGEYTYCYRYAYLGGPWVYGDLDGSANGFSPEQTGLLTVAALPPIGWCNLERPATLALAPGVTSPVVLGRVWIDGATGQLGATLALVAELGYGPDGSDPSVDGSTWQWTPASYRRDVDDADEFAASLTVIAPGTYDYAYRYSYASGPWVYGDLDGLENGYSPAQSGSLTVGGPAAVSGGIAARLRLHPGVPNPFNPRTTIKYDLPEAGPVRLAVFDLAGRLVRTLVDESKAQGSFDVVWDGRDSSGREISSGTYLARLFFGGRVETVRMGLIR